MIIELPPQIEQAIISKANHIGISVESYVAMHLTHLANNTNTAISVADLIHGKQLESFGDDPVAFQRAMRDD